jgi:hypothetical protein
MDLSNQRTKHQQMDDMVTDGKLRNKSVGIDKEAKVEV